MENAQERLKTQLTELITKRVGGPAISSMMGAIEFVCQVVESCSSGLKTKLSSNEKEKFAVLVAKQVLSELLRNRIIAQVIFDQAVSLLDNLDMFVGMISDVIIIWNSATDEVGCSSFCGLFKKQKKVVVARSGPLPDVQPLENYPLQPIVEPVAAVAAAITSAEMTKPVSTTEIAVPAVSVTEVVVSVTDVPAAVPAAIVSPTKTASIVFVASFDPDPIA